MKPLFILAFCCFYGIHCFAQLGGKHVYEFLSMPASARITGLGGQVIGVMDDDVSLALGNPASLNDRMHNHLSFAHDFFFEGVQNGYVSYARKWDKWNINTHIGAHYINYGDFIRSDVLGNQDGNFGAAETALVLGVSKKIADRLYAGANLKGVFSHFDTYSSTGIAADLGLNYVNDSSDFVVSLVVKNLGTQLTTYVNDRYSTPMDVQIGITKRLKHLPFRFSIIAHQLHKLDIRYDDPDQKQTTDIFGEPIKENPVKNAVDNVFRHLVFNGEFLLGKNENLRIRAGYNHLRRKELSLSTFRSLAGFSLGFGIKVNAFRLDYGVGYHHLAGAANHITISADMNRFFNKI